MHVLLFRMIATVAQLPVQSIVSDATDPRQVCSDGSSSCCRESKSVVAAPTDKAASSSTTSGVVDVVPSPIDPDDPRCYWCGTCYNNNNGYSYMYM